MSSDQHKILGKVFFGKYLSQKRIGKGSFGTVCEGINTKTNERIAIKFEKKEKGKNGTLETEAYRLLYLQGEGVPKIYCYGNNSTHNILVQELLGESLDSLFNKNNKKFSLKTVCVLGIEMIKRIEFIHSKNHIHRDIKPDNFTIGRDENINKIYIIDFGLSKKYFSESKQRHIKFCKGKSLIGTARYCGRNTHKGYEQSRRDDIESIGYVLMYFLLGVLPWQGLKVKNGEDHFDAIAKKKINTPFEELCKGQPNEFLEYFKYVDKIEFEEKPNYQYFISLFQTMINKYCADCNYDFDWNKNEMNYFPENYEDKPKPKDISLFVNQNVNANSISNESCNKGIKENKNVFLCEENDENGNDYSFEKGSNGNNDNDDDIGNKYGKQKNKNKYSESDSNKVNTDNLAYKSIHDEDADRDNKDDERDERNSKKIKITVNGKKKSGRARSMPKDYTKDYKFEKPQNYSGINGELTDSNPGGTTRNEQIKGNDIHYHHIPIDNNNGSITEYKVDNNYHHLGFEEKVSKKSGQAGKRKRNSSDDFKRQKNQDKEETKCGCIIF